MRTRERGELTNESYESKNHWHNNDSGDSGTSTKTFNSTTGELETMSDVVVPRFQERSARGEIFNNPLSKRKVSTLLTPGTMQFRHEWGNVANGEYTNHSWSPNYRPFSDKWTQMAWTHLGHGINIANLQDKAGTDANANVAAPDVYGAVGIGELRETLGFLRNPAKAYADFAKRAKRDKRRSASKRARAQSVGQFVGDNWLGYRYGLQPIVADIEGVMNAAARIANEYPRLTARGYATDHSSKEESRTETIGVIEYDYQHITETNIEVRAGVLYHQEAGFDPYGLGFAEIPLAAWELIPYSFVADWFLNVGSFIEALTPRVGVRRLASWTTTRITQRSAIIGQAVSLSGDRVLTGSAPTIGLYETESVTRTPGTRIGLAYNPIPFPKDGFGLKRVADSFALAQNILNSR